MTVSQSIFALLLAVSASVCRADFEWKQCLNGASGSFLPESVNLTPDPVTSGSSFEFIIDGKYAPSNGYVVKAGTLNINVLFMGTPIYNTEWDLCDKTACPVKPGPWTLKYSQMLPPIAPPGQYTVTLEASADNGETLFCMDVDFEIVMPTPNVIKAVKNVLKSSSA